MPNKSGIARRLAKALTRRFEPRQRVSRAVITSVQKDVADRVIGATASIDGLVSQRVYIDHGSNLQTGDILDVVNRGGAAGPAWYALRRVRTTVPIPTLPFGTTLPTPTALTLTTGTYSPATGGGTAAWIYASFRTINPVYGSVGYQCEYRMNDELDDDPTVLGNLDPRTYTTLTGSLSSSMTVIPRAATEDYDFAKTGVIQIDSELIHYTGATRTAGIWLYPYSLGGTSFSLRDYVEDTFTDTDTTNITAHTPDYDRYAGGWYVIPTYSSNWAISSNKIAATPGGTWPYSAAIIDSMATSWYAHRLRGDWTWPASGQFGYIVDYVDASNFVYVRYDMTNEQFEIVERISAVETTVWTQADDSFTAAQVYTFEAQAVAKTVHIKISGGDLDADIEYTATDALTNIAESSSVGIWSDVAVTMDNFWLDDARERSLVDDEWIDFVYYAVGFDRVKITGNEYSAVAHSHTFDTSGDPGATGGSTYPAFVGCTRGYDNTTATTHAAGAGIYAQSLGFMLQPLVGSMDYNVRVRAHLSETVFSPWSDWSTIKSAADTTAPTAPTGFVVTNMPGALEFSWTGPSMGDVPDLAGFNIYTATDGYGAGATLLRSLSVGLSSVVQIGAGTVAYYNIKAVDHSENLSGYGASPWERGESLYPPGEQWLTNSDFERDAVTSGDPDEWNIASVGGTYALGAYGWGGGQGIRFSLDNTDTADLDWPKSLTDTSIQRPIEQYVTYVIAIKMKCSDTAWEWNMGDTPPIGKTRIKIWPKFYGGVTNPVGAWGYDWSAGIGGAVDLGSGWELIWATVTVWIDTDDFIGFDFVVGNGSGSSITVDVDQAQLGRGVTYADWVPSLSRVDGSAGLLFDTAGLESDGLVVSADGRITSDIPYDGDLKPTRSGDEYTGEVILDHGYVTGTGDSSDPGTSALAVLSQTGVVVPAGCTLRVSGVLTCHATAYTAPVVILAQVLSSSGSYNRISAMSIRGNAHYIALPVELNWTYSSKVTTTVSLRFWKNATLNTVIAQKTYCSLAWEVVG